MIIQYWQFSRLTPFHILWTYAMNDGNYLLFRFKWILVNIWCYLNMSFENEVFGLARVRISEVQINEGLLYLYKGITLKHTLLRNLLILLRLTGTDILRMSTLCWQAIIIWEKKSHNALLLKVLHLWLVNVEELLRCWNNALKDHGHNPELLNVLCIILRMTT